MAFANVANVENSAMPLDVAIQAWWWHYKNNGPSSWYNTLVHMSIETYLIHHLQIGIGLWVVNL